jgi:hypothetical protein
MFGGAPLASLYGLIKHIGTPRRGRTYQVRVCCVLLTHTVSAVGDVIGGTKTSSGVGPAACTAAVRKKETTRESGVVKRISWVGNRK